MLKDIIRIKGKIKQKEYKTIHELVKKYFIVWLESKSDLGTIKYRNHELIIHDNGGWADAIAIEEDLRQQVVEINKIEEIKEVIGYEL